MEKKNAVQVNQQMPDRRNLVVRVDEYQLGLPTKNNYGTFGVVRFAQHDNNYYAIKIFQRPLTAEEKARESDSLQEITKKHNQHIVDFISFRQEAKCYSPYFKEPKKTSILVLQNVRGYELLDYLCKSRFSEEIAWYFFRQLIDGLQAIHTAGYAHRDLKLENLMITVNAQGEPILKIIDFGHSIKIEKDKKYQPDGGTPSINDPCFYNKMLPYDPFKADIFSAGVVLLRMITRSEVFDQASKQYGNFLLVIKGSWQEFWLKAQQTLSKSSKLTSKKTISPDLKHFLQKLLVPNANARLSIQQIKKIPWFFNIKQPDLKAFVDLKLILEQKLGKRSAEIQIASEYYQDNPKVDLSVLPSLLKQDQPDLVVDYGFEELYARIRWISENDERRKYVLSVEEGEGRVTILVKVGEERVESYTEEKEYKKEEGKVEPEIQIQLFKDHNGKKLALYFTRNQELESLTFYEIKDDIMSLL